MDLKSGLKPGDPKPEDSEEIDRSLPVYFPQKPLSAVFFSPDILQKSQFLAKFLFQNRIVFEVPNDLLNHGFSNDLLFMTLKRHLRTGNRLPRRKACETRVGRLESVHRHCGRLPNRAAPQKQTKRNDRDDIFFDDPPPLKSHTRLYSLYVTVL